MKKIMIVAGGQWQIPLVKKAKEMGLYVICSNLYPDSPAFPYADACEVADVRDREKNLEFARKHRPDAIVTDQSDIAVGTVAWLNEQLGLRGIGSAVAERFTNKYEMRRFGRAHGFPMPDFQLCHELEEAAAFLDRYGDVIVKPMDSQASRGVRRVRSHRELEAAFPAALGYSNRDQAVLIEQYVSGTEFTVDGICCEGRHHSLAVSEKRHYEKYPNVASVLYFSQTNPRFDYDRLKQQNDALAERMGLPFGLTHAEYIWHDGEYYLVEIAARGGGSNISGKIVPLMSGVDSTGTLLRMALGERVGWYDLGKDPVPRTRCCVLEFYDFPAGRVRSVHGLDFLEQSLHIVEHRFLTKPGDWLGEPEDDGVRPGHFIAYADTQEELEEIRRQVKRQVYVEYDE
ncbi:ATP-grasp domain-containing protein [Anaerotruncus colihominis]|uniref:ATP-grasp domain-containing protein n=1 Tax=Anaerotruncus colihominis TaxID=169435 RepID=UPI0026EA3314|nr:ATP-grasp domain-containing protein [Anaerotruncus colihominis]